MYIFADAFKLDKRKNYMKLEDLMERASKYDETLARDIKDYVHGRKYGLVYEASKPEFVRMWKKPVVRGDLVNMLPPRGIVEDTKSEEDPSEVVYKVIGINGSVAKLRNTETGEDTAAAVDDVVALARFDRPIYAGLKELDRVERGGDKPYHLVINGENYHALQTLVYAYQGMVDCIYIDPPYNSGASDWKYNNNYVGKDDQYRHSKWLTFMEDRLKLAKKLLNPEDSVLIVTIDEKEYLRLGLLLEQLFPEATIQMTTIVINRKGSARTQFARVEEYAFFVFLGDAVVPTYFSDYLSYGENASDEMIVESEPRWERLLRGGTGSRREDSPTLFYPVYVDPVKKKLLKAGEILPLGEMPDFSHIDDKSVAWPIRKDGSFGRWQTSPDTLNMLIDKGFAKLGTWDKKRQTWTVLYLNRGTRKRIEDGEILITGRNPEDNVVSVKYARPEAKMYAIKSVWFRKTHDSGVYGSTLLRSIIGHDRKFDFPKSLYSTKDTIQAVLRNKKEALVVDFFAGSGTTLHAISLLNVEDGGTRRCISVTNNEVSADETKALTKRGLRPGDSEWEQYGIAHYVTWPRIKCVIEGVDSKGNPLNGDYGCETETYEEYIGEVIDPKTSKKTRKKLYEKVNKPIYPALSCHPMADGFEENAVFFDLVYLEPSVVGADLAYDSIAPILWMCGGCKGEILSRHKGYVIGETYAVLFDPRYTKGFVDVVIDIPEVSTVFIVTDIAESYRSLCAELPGKRVMQLYDSYLRSFEINAIG